MFGEADTRPFASARAKLGKGMRHAAETQELIRAYSESHPWQTEVDGRYSTHSAALTWKKPIPDSIMLAAGDAIHNFRSALDHCTFELWKLERSNLLDKDIYFPVSDCGSKFEKRIKALQPASQSSAELLRQFQPYPTGNGEDLYHLHKLDNIDKHRFLNLALATVKVTGLKEGFYDHETNSMKYEYMPPVEIGITSETKESSGSATIQGYVLACTIIGHRDAEIGSPFDFSEAVGDFRLSLKEHAPYSAEEMISTLYELGDRVGLAVNFFSHYHETGEVLPFPPPADRR